MSFEAPRGAATRILASLLEARTGQTLSPSRSWRLEQSLRPLIDALALPSLEALVACIWGGRDDALATRVIEALLNNETSFFRDAAAFQTIDRDVFGELHARCERRKRVRIWSAGCSTGQEPYSVAMRLRDQSRWDGWAIDIVATDISGSAIARAKEGRYSQFEIQRGLPVRTMLKYFRQSGDEWETDPSLRRAVRFAVHHLADPAPGQFDLILCRNVLMYFASPLRRTVFDRLADALAPGGMLVLGAGETVIGQSDRFALHPMLKGVYEADERGSTKR